MKTDIDAIVCCACAALAEEVSLTPKPGLVDAQNTGAHRDMCLETFTLSIEALRPHFHSYGTLGMTTPWEELFEALKIEGKEAERSMFEATGGVNTHKGANFIMALVLGICGYMLQSGQQPSAHGILDSVKALVAEPMTRQLKGIRNRMPTSSGERFYQKYDIRGIRGEAMDGFPTVKRYGLPVLQGSADALRDSDERQRVLLKTLFSLMAYSEDTTVVKRGGIEALMEVQKVGAELYATFADASHWMASICVMDQYFIRKNISPGGSADLLALTILLDGVEKMFL